jgi:predicted oxidoreductase
MIPRLHVTPHGPSFSRLAYGTWRLLDDAIGAAPSPLCERLQQCAAMGLTTIDTAEIYGHYRVEQVLGLALARDRTLRAKLEIVTKAGIYIPSATAPERKVSFYDASGARLVRSAEQSLQLMGIDHIDLLLVHRPDWLTSVDDTAEGLNRLLKDGKIRAAGVSNYNVHQFEALNARLDQPLVTNQIEFSLLRMDPMVDGIMDQCQRHRISPMAWSPLAGGRLLRSDDEAAIRVQQLAAELAPKYGGATVDQLAYAWILAHPSKPMPIVGSNKIERVARAALAADIVLEREDWYAMWTAAQGRRIP